MEVIARKQIGVGILYIATIIVSAILAFIFQWISDIFDFFQLFRDLFILLVISISVVLIDYCFVPFKLIILLKEYTIQLPKKNIISFADITEINFKEEVFIVKRHYGDIIITTREKTYRIRFVKECEKVAQTLNEMLKKYQEYYAQE